MNDRGDKDPEKNSEDDALWRHVTKTVEPLRDRNVEGILEPGQTTSDAAPEKKTHAKKDNSADEKTPNTKPAKRKDESPVDKSVDIRTAEKFRRGQMAIEATLDLHGMDRRTAQDRLETFILSSWEQKKRCVLVITGKGRAGQDDDSRWRLTPGVIRSSLPSWLDDRKIADKVLMTSTAKPQHGGDGAFYILLRRKR